MVPKDLLNDSEALKNFLLNFGTYPILGILFGMFITVLLQSSSAIMVPICFDLSSEHSILVQ